MSDPGATCWERDEHRCFRCGAYLSSAWPGYSCHHRQLQGSGGPDTPENRIMLCGSGTTGCHGWVHANPAVARAHGWLVSKFTGHPELVPAEHHSRGWLLLAADGSFAVAAASGGEQR